MNKKTICILIVLFSSTLFSGCAVGTNFGPYIGKVVDADTKEPIEGAVVFMECMTKTGNIGGVQSHYADAKEVMTDSKGEFHIELRPTTYRPGHLWDFYPSITIFKPGYGVFPWHSQASVDIIIKDTSHHFPVNTFVTITLPNLKTREEMVRNLGRLPSTSAIPFEKKKIIIRLKNIERVKLGFEPIDITK